MGKAASRDYKNAPERRRAGDGGAIDGGAVDDNVTDDNVTDDDP